MRKESVLVTTSKVDLGTFLRDVSPEPELIRIIFTFASIGIKIQELLAKAPIDGLTGFTGETNVQKELVAKMDEEANTIMVAAFASQMNVKSLISEEEENPISFEGGQYTLCFDPLDGSSNIGIAPVGSILGVYNQPLTSESFEKGVYGGEQIAAAFTVYGIPTMFVLAFAGKGVNGFTRDPDTRFWILTHPNIQIPKPKYTSVNWMYQNKWPDSVKAGVESASQGLKGRYSGSLVEDILRVLLEGGIFFYPEDSESPNGKLRMLYENNPIGLIIEEAGGRASNGRQPILDVSVTEFHQRSAFIAGNAELVNLYDSAYNSV